MAEALEQIHNFRTLADLKPQIGTKVQVAARSSRTKYSLQLLGYREGGSVMLSAPSQFTGINEGSSITVRMMSGNFICAFSAKLMKIQTLPYLLWHIEYPKEIEVRRVRNYIRVPVNLVVSMDEFEEGTDPSREWPIMAMCTDISLSGARVNAPVVFGKEGDKIFMITRFKVAGIDQVILIPSIIRSITHLEEGVARVATHGLQFLELDEESHLILSSFVYQQFLIETGHMEVINV